MPIYEFTCRSCGSQLELLVRGSETPACPRCRSEDLERRYSVFSVGGKGPDLATREPPGP